MNSNAKLVAALIRRVDAMAKMIVIFIRKTMILVTKIFVTVCTIEYRNFPPDIFLKYLFDTFVYHIYYIHL